MSIISLGQLDRSSKDRLNERFQKKVLQERFEGKIRPDSCKCWLWNGAVRHDGYGKISISGNADGPWMLAHRVAYELFIGSIPLNKSVLRMCNETRCVNPHHLILGNNNTNRIRSLQMRFMQNFKKTTGCWEWLGSKKSNGYGVIGRGGRGGGSVYVHRLSYEIFIGPIPDGLYVCHTCDNRPCVRPSHLFIGTQKDNMVDAWNKGRLNLPTETGEDHYAAKLTREQVVNILEERKHKRTKRKILARRYGISINTLDCILYGRTWKTIDRQGIFSGATSS